MSTVSIRELRNHGGDVVDRVMRGETITVTRRGVPVGELRPLAGSRLTGPALLERWRRLPKVDPARFRADLDDVLDPAL